VETVAAAGGQNRPRGGCSGVDGGGQSGRLPTSHWDRPRWGRRGRAQFLLLLYDIYNVYIYIYFFVTILASHDDDDDEQTVMDRGARRPASFKRVLSKYILISYRLGTIL